MYCRTFMIPFSAYLLLSAHSVLAQPTPAEALKLRPMQQVEYDRPTEAETQNCKVSPEQWDSEMALVIRGPSGELLRQFVDSNRDNKIDQWRYFRSGIEVYRDIDADFNGKADQYRWFGMAGTRWGLDEDEDGIIDAWKTISAEEVSAEVVEAIQNGNQKRFTNVLLSSSELDALGLGRKLNSLLVERIQSAQSNFKRAVDSRTDIGTETTWIDFGGLRPGTIPAGTDGSTRDVTVYENVIAMVETDGQPAQIPIGTLVKVAEGWRVVDLPRADDDESAPFVFFEGARRLNAEESAGVGEETQKLIAKLQQIDDRLDKATDPDEVARINQQRADTLEQLANAATRSSDREMWLTQFVDTVGTAAQTGSYPEGTRRLGKVRQALERTSNNDELVAHAVFTHMSAQYAERLQREDDFGKVQDDWLKQLESFVQRFPETSDAPEAMLQLALAKEFAGEEQEANRWYTSIVKEFAESPIAAKAAGAKRRIECIGKPLALRGRSVDGKPFDLKRLAGNVVLVHYWATWCEPCREDMETIKALRKELAGEKFQVVGINLDSQKNELARHFRADRPQWTHLFEEGGLDSRLASEMGIFTLPVMLLLDERGRVVNRQLHGGQLADEVRKLLK